MNTLTRAMLKALRSYELDGVLAADFRTVKSLLASGFITWNSTRSCYEPNDAGLQALADHEASNEPDPELLDWLIASTQVEDDPDDEPASVDPASEPAPAEPAPVVEPALPKPKRTRTRKAVPV